MVDLRFLLQKLDVMSGALYRIQYYVRETYNRVKALSNKSDVFFSEIKIGNIIVKGRIEKITMNEFQFVEATFTAKKHNGQPAQIQDPVAETDNPEVCTAEIAGPNTAKFSAVEGSVTEPTAVLCKVRGDADLGEGVNEIEAVGSITITPGQAETIELAFGEPQNKA